MGAKNFYQRILQKFQTKSEISVMGTKDLCLQLLQKMNIEVHVDEEEKEHYYFVGCSVRCSEKQMLKSPVKLLI